MPELNFGKARDDARSAKAMANTGANRSRMSRPGMMLTMIVGSDQVNRRAGNYHR